MKLRTWFFAATTLGSGFSALAVTPKAIIADKFAIEKAPSDVDWRYFRQMLPASRAKLWQDSHKRGKALKDWAWGWRLGWVQVCIDDPAAYCRQIIKDALTDKALVVRAEAATQIGRKYEGSGDSNMLAALTAAYADTRNLRRGKPMYVQKRILYAIKQIGGKSALNTGKRLAQGNAQTDNYWTKLNHL